MHKDSKKKYYIDKDTELVCFAKQADLDINKAYKGYTWNTLKQANNFKNKIYKTHLDDLGLKKKIDIVWNMPRIKSEIARKLELIQEKENLLSLEFPSGFENSVEWRRRLEQEQEWKFLKYMLIALRLQAQEIIQREVFLSSEQIKGIGANEASNCIDKGIYRGRFNTPLIREVTEQYRKDKLTIESAIQDSEENYRKLHESYRLDDSFLDRQKDYLINYLCRLRKLRNVQRQNQISVYLYSENEEGRIETKKLKDLTYEDVKHSITADRYNLYIKRKNKVRSVRFVFQINERLACFDYEWRLLTNEDVIIIDKEFVGENLDYLDSSLSFCNDNEVNYRRWEENSPRVIDEVIGRRVVKAL